MAFEYGFKVYSVKKKKKKYSVRCHHCLPWVGGGGNHQVLEKHETQSSWSMYHSLIFLRPLTVIPSVETCDSSAGFRLYKI